MMRRTKEAMGVVDSALGKRVREMSDIIEAEKDIVKKQCLSVFRNRRYNNRGISETCHSFITFFLLCIILVFKCIYVPPFASSLENLL